MPGSFGPHATFRVGVVPAQKLLFHPNPNPLPFSHLLPRLAISTPLFPSFWYFRFFFCLPRPTLPGLSRVAPCVRQQYLPIYTLFFPDRLPYRPRVVGHAGWQTRSRLQSAVTAAVVRSWDLLQPSYFCQDHYSHMICCRCGEKRAIEI